MESVHDSGSWTWILNQTHNPQAGSQRRPERGWTNGLASNKEADYNRRVNTEGRTYAKCCLRLPVCVRGGFAPRPQRKGMAIFHLSVKTISRSAGRSATAAAAYRAGVKMNVPARFTTTSAEPVSNPSCFCFRPTPRTGPPTGRHSGTLPSGRRPARTPRWPANLRLPCPPNYRQTSASYLPTLSPARSLSAMVARWMSLSIPPATRVTTATTTLTFC